MAQVARELGLNETVLRRWMGLYGKRAGGRPRHAGGARGADPAAAGESDGSRRSGTS